MVGVPVDVGGAVFVGEFVGVGVNVLVKVLVAVGVMVEVQGVWEAFMQGVKAEVEVTVGVFVLTSTGVGVGVGAGKVGPLLQEEIKTMPANNKTTAIKPPQYFIASPRSNSRGFMERPAY